MSAPWFGGQQPQDPEKSGVLDPLLDEQGVQRTSDGSHGNQHDRFIASYDHQPDGDAAEVGEHNAPAKMSWAAWLLLAAAVRCHTFDRKAFKSSCTYEAVQLSSLTILSRAAAQLTVKSSAGAVFASLPEVGAITIAAWRMQLAAVIMLPVAIWQYRHASAGDPHVSFSVNGHCCDARVTGPLFLVRSSLSTKCSVLIQTLHVASRRCAADDAQQVLAAGGVGRIAGGAVVRLRMGGGPHQPVAHAAVPVSNADAAGRLALGQTAADFRKCVHLSASPCEGLCTDALLRLLPQHFAFNSTCRVLTLLHMHEECMKRELVSCSCFAQLPGGPLTPHTRCDPLPIFCRRRAERLRRGRDWSRHPLAQRQLWRVQPPDRRCNCAVGRCRQRRIADHRAPPAAGALPRASVHLQLRCDRCA